MLVSTNAKHNIYKNFMSMTNSSASPNWLLLLAALCVSSTKLRLSGN
jgi:hypothetical protein